MSERVWRRIYEFGVRFSASADWIEEPQWDEPGTWYPDVDGLQDARAAAGELVDALGQFEWELDAESGLSSCPCCGANKYPDAEGKHLGYCTLGRLLAKARGEASDAD